MIDIQKTCTYCKHGLIFGWHAVRIDCKIDGKSMAGYSSENEYRLNAKDCIHFEPKCNEVWSNELQRSVKKEEVNWI